MHNTSETIRGPGYNKEPITSDVIIMEDHFPYYTLDHKKPIEVLLVESKGQNMLVDFAINPQDKIWIYDSYLCLDNSFDNIFIPNMQLGIENYNTNNGKPKLNRKYKFVSFNNKSRFHRIITSSWINENFKQDEYFYTAGFNVEQDGIREHLLFTGELYPGLPKKLIGPDPFYPSTANIFKEHFYPIASEAVFNIVNDVSFWEYGCHLSEKTFWAILGYNIPIISGYKMAKSMETIGFDMFRDIVNYRSENIKNPFIRTFNLLNDNKEIIQNAKDILDKSILQRLEYNKNLLLQSNIKEIAIKKLNTPKMIDKLDELVYNKTISKGLIV